MRGFRNHVVLTVPVFVLVLSLAVGSVGLSVASADSTLSHTDTAVVDRFEGNIAVLVFDSGDVQTVERSQLPLSARHVDAVLHVTRDGDTIMSMRYDAEETRERREQAQDRFDRLTHRASLLSGLGIPCGYDRAASPLAYR